MFQICETDIGLEMRINDLYYGYFLRGKWMGTDVAIRKVYDLSINNSESYLNNELEELSRIRHPNIIHLLAMNVHENEVKFIYEYMDSYNLEEVMFMDSEIPGIRSDLKIQNKIALDIIKAVTYLHYSQPLIIHGDINPTNILISKSGFIAKLCDYGTSRTVDNDFCKRYMSSKMQFKSPEQLMNPYIKADYSDIWSFGASMILFFTGLMPWMTTFSNDDQQKQTILKEKINEKLEPDYLSALPVEQLNILKNCFDYNTRSRIKALDLMTLVEMLEI